MPSKEPKEPKARKEPRQPKEPKRPRGPKGRKPAAVGNLRARQIRAVEEGNPFTRMAMVASLLAGRARDAADARKRDVASGPRPGESDLQPDTHRGQVRSLLVVQSYLVMLFLVDVLSAAVILSLALLFSYLVLTGRASIAFLEQVPLLTDAMGRVANLASWVTPLLENAVSWLAGLLPFLAAAARWIRDAGPGGVSWLAAVSPLVAAGAYAGLSSVLRKSIVANLRKAIA